MRLCCAVCVPASVVTAAVLLALVPASSATIYSWGSDAYDQVTDTPNGTGYTAIAGGESHSLALAAPVAAIPEPATAALALLGAGGLMCRRRAA